MNDSEQSNAFDHRFTDTVQNLIGDPGYGDWRSVSAPEAVSLGYGFPFPDSLPEAELAAAVQTVLETEGSRALQYGGGDYAEELETIVADRAREHGIGCEKSNVLLTNGATHALDAVCRAFLSPGDSLFVEGPTFMGALSLFRNHGADVHSFDVDSAGLDVDAVAEELRRRRARNRDPPKALYTIPNFQNPTGVTLSLSRRTQLLELAAEHDFVVIEDDAYGDLRYDGDPIPSLAELDDEGRVVRIGTFSKTIAPGVRTGWLVAHEEIVEAIRKLNAGGTNTFTQSIVARYCATDRFDENVVELRRAYEKRRDRMFDSLETHMPPAADWTEPNGGFFVWVTLPSNVDTEKLAPDAAENGVTYLPGSMFFPDGEGANCLRLSFSYAPLAELDRGIEALGKTVRDALAE